MSKILIVIPAYNEEKLLLSSIVKLYGFCQQRLGSGWRIVVADNQSTDRTAAIAKSLATEYPGVDYLSVGIKGKGAAIRAGWQSATADIYCFMDADLATDLAALPDLILAIESGSDVAIGSRYLPASKVTRTLGRRFFSIGYRLALKLILGTKVHDLPCGFKAINSKIKESILPVVTNNNWFFDSELVLIAEKRGFNIAEIPVTWSEPRGAQDKSRVNLVAVARSYLSEISRLKTRLKKM